MRVLISLLGLSPGVVTGAYYALYRGTDERPPVAVDKVVTLGTNAPGMDDCEWAITDEFERWRQDEDVEVMYDPTCRLRIPHPDLNTDESLADFRKAITELLRDTYQDSEVYLCVAGGRKTMAGLAALAVQLFGRCVRGMYHLYVHSDLERDGSVDGRFWDVSIERRQAVMRPPEEQCWLVEIPFISIRKDGKLSLRGKVDADLERALRGRLEVLDEQGREKYWDYVLEVKVADYVRLHKKYPVSIPNHRHRDLPHNCRELDVYAELSHERFEKRLVVECKLRHILDPDDKPVDVGAVKQVLRRLEALHAVLAPQVEGQGKELRLEGWVVCNASTATPEAWGLAQERGVQLLWADLPRGWNERPRDWQIARLVPIPAPQQEA